MNKEGILREIKRIAVANGGKAPGRLMFETETGARESDWRGRYWSRWNDAIREAGLEPNEKNVAYDEAYLIEKLISLARENGHFPTSSELRLKKRHDPQYPHETVYRRLGGKQDIIARVLTYARSRADLGDVVALCEAAIAPAIPDIRPMSNRAADEGFVYLIKSGRHYKIGRSNAVGRREYELAIQLPEKSNTVHTIRTDDPVGIEAYWHKRFGEKRMNGEWFNLNAQDVAAFKKRKFM